MGTTVRGPWLGLVLLVAAGTVACSGTAGTPTVDTDYTHVTVTAQHTVRADAIGGDTALVLPSPDGSKVYSLTKGKACITTLADSHTVCAKHGPSTPSRYWARWAPDSHAVALTDDLRVTLHEPDIWVMDAADGAMTNLTDDGEDEVLAPAGSTPPQLDLLPVWRDDATILFARQHGRRAKSMVIASVPAAGGAVTVLAKIDATLSNLNAIAVQPGTSAIAYSVASHDMRSATVYLRRTEPGSEPSSKLGNKPGTGPSTDRTGPAPSGRTAPPTTDDRVLLHATYDASLLSFSADGQHLLADNLLPRGMYTTMDDPKPQVVRVKDGTVTPVAKGTPVWYPTWSPTGHALAFLPHRDGGVLQTVADPGGMPHPLADAAIAATPYQDLTWTPSELLVRAKKGVTVLTMDNE